MSNHQRVLKVFAIGGAVLTAFILLLLFASVVVSSNYVDKNQRRNTTSTLLAENVSLQFDYPLYLFLQEEPSDLRLNVWSNDGLAFAEPFTVTLVIPDGMQVVTPTMNANDRVVVFSFLPEDGRVQNGRVLLQNAGTATASQTQVIAAESTLHPKIPPMEIELNSPPAAAVSSFFRDSLSSNGPILLAIAAAGSIMAWLLRYYQNQADLERKREAERERGKNAEAFELASNMRQHLIRMNFQGVERVWLQLSSQNMLDRLEPYERRWLEQLKTVASSGLGENDARLDIYKTYVDEIKVEWTNETAGAIMCAYKSAQKKSGEANTDKRLATYRHWIRNLDFSRIDNAGLRNECQRTWFELRDEIQYDVPDIEGELAPDAPAPEGEPYPPLTHKRAEDEETTLYKKNAFWSGHKAYAEFLNHLERNQLIFGASGSGLTALAKGIWANESRWTPYFWVYMPVFPGMSPDLNSINIILSRHLLKYGLDKPLRLISLEASQRELLAQVLVQAFSGRYVCANIERVVAEEAWLKGTTEIQYAEWKWVGQTQLDLLAESVRKQEGERPFTDYQWLYALIATYRALGFSQLCLLFDFAPKTVELAGKMIYLWGEWQSRGVISTFFLSKQAKERLHLQQNEIQQIELVWDAGQLNELIRHRYYRIERQRQAYRFIGGTREKYDAFLESLEKPLTPRLLIERLHGEHPPEKHDAAIDESGTVAINQERNRFLDWALSRFNMDDLTRICYRLGKSIDDMKGSTRERRLISIIEFCEEHERVPELLVICNEMRPQNWLGFAPWI